MDADSDVNIADKVTQQTPLHEAMCQHYVPAAHLLIDKGGEKFIHRLFIFIWT